MLDSLRENAERIRNLPSKYRDVDALRATCAQQGWPEDPPGSERFLIASDLAILTGEGDDEEETIPTRVNIYSWEDWDEEDHATRDEFLAAEKRFDQVFAEASEILRDQWGPPLKKGSYKLEEFRFSWAMWEGQGGLRILAQDEPDIQYGVEVVIWIVPWKKGKPLPEMPLF